ncbi:MAG: ABC transporter permease [Candidatus Bipolaricaulaceae bacterium]
MLNYVLRGFLALLPMWVAVSLFTFSIMYMIPGDPLVSILGPCASPEARERMIKSMHLDDPFWVRYGKWLAGVVRGDLGQSIFLGRSVSQAIWDRLPVTLALGVGAVLVAPLLGLPPGIFSAIRRNSLLDTAVMTAALAGLSTPEFLLGLVLIYVFAVDLRLLPVGGYVPLTRDFVSAVRHLIMPCFTLGVIWAALIARMTRATMLDVLGRDFVTTARAKGLPERFVIWRHTLRVAVIPITTVVGFVIILVVSGAFITEIVFSLPGMGNLVVNFVLKRDYPVVQGAMLFIATGILLINLLIDLLYAYLDPRVKYD